MMIMSMMMTMIIIIMMIRIYIVQLDCLVVGPNRQGCTWGAVNYPSWHLEYNLLLSLFVRSVKISPEKLTRRTSRASQNTSSLPTEKLTRRRSGSWENGCITKSVLSLLEQAN